MSETTAIPHPPIPRRNASAEYRIWLNGEEVYVPSIIGFSGGTIAFLPFDMTGPVEVRILADRAFEEAEVRPHSAGIPCTRDGNSITFTVKNPCNLFVRWDHGFELPVYLFASRPQSDLPSPDAPGVHYFGPGVHEAGEIRLSRGEHLYLAPGAWVHGYVVAENADDVRISGRGVLCGSKYTSDYGPGAPAPYLVSFSQCRNVRVEGVVILDAWSWTLVFKNCEHVHVDAARLICERLRSTDGINPCNSRHVLIENCFARTKDDCVSIKGLDYHRTEIPAEISLWTPIRDITVRNCVFWSENNNGIVVGTETRASVIEDIRFENIDLLKCSNTCGDVAGAMAVLSLHDTLLQNIVFENIRIEHATGPWLVMKFLDQIFRIPSIRRPEGGTIRKVLFRNIAILGGPHRPAYIQGMDEKHRIENIAFEHLTIHGRFVSDFNTARLRVGAHVNDLTINGFF